MKMLIRNIEPFYDSGEQHFRLETDIYVDKEIFSLLLYAIDNNEIDFSKLEEIKDKIFKMG